MSNKQARQKNTSPYIQTAPYIPTDILVCVCVILGALTWKQSYRFPISKLCFSDKMETERELIQGPVLFCFVLDGGPGTLLKGIRMAQVFTFSSACFGQRHNPYQEIYAFWMPSALSLKLHIILLANAVNQVFSKLEYFNSLMNYYWLMYCAFCHFSFVCKCWSSTSGNNYIC